MKVSDKASFNLSVLILGASIVLSALIVAVAWTGGSPLMDEAAKASGWTLEIDPASKAIASLPGSRSGWFRDGLRLSRFARIRRPVIGASGSILMKVEVEGIEGSLSQEETDNYEEASRRYLANAVIQWGVKEKDAWSFVLSPGAGETGIFLTRGGSTRKLGIVREASIPDREKLLVEVEISPSHIVARVDGLEIARSSGYGVPEGDIALASYVRECWYHSFSLETVDDGAVTEFHDRFRPWTRLIKIWAFTSCIGAAFSFIMLLLLHRRSARMVMALALSGAYMGSGFLLTGIPSVEARIVTAVIWSVGIWWTIMVFFRKHLRQEPLPWRSAPFYYHVCAFSLLLLTGAFTPRPLHFTVAAAGCSLFSWGLNLSSKRLSILPRPVTVDLILITPSVFYGAALVYKEFPSDAAILVSLCISSLFTLFRIILNDVHIRLYNFQCLFWFGITLFFLEMSLQLSPLPRGAWRDRAGKTSIGAVFWTPSEDGRIQFRRGFYPQKKSSFTKRIISLGGSSTMGWPLKDPSAPYPAKLEKMLQKDGNKVEVLNAGVGGYTSFQGVKFLEEELLKWSPDAVTFCFGANDSNNNLEVGIGVTDRRYWEIRQKMSKIPMLMAITELSGRLVLPGMYRRLLFAWFPPEPVKRVPVDDFVQNINIFADLGSENSFIPILMFEAEHRLPDLSRAIDRNPYYRALVDAATSRNIMLVDTVAVLQGPFRDSYFMDNVHLSETGHMMVARGLFRALRENDILSRWQEE